MRPLRACAAILLLSSFVYGAEEKDLFTEAVPKAPAGKQWFVSPEGKEANAGTRESPWDIGTAVGGGQKIAPGDRVWLLGGTYKCPDRRNGWYTVSLKGTKQAPIIVRAFPGQHPVVDGGFALTDGASNVWLWDIEILVSEGNREVTEKGSAPEIARPNGGIHVGKSEDVKLIGLVIHDCNQGMGVWTDALGTEIHGCVIYGNGWQGPDRHHGHCIYTQNKDGVKTISNNILIARKDKTDGSYTMHAYGSAKAFISNFTIEDNIAYRNGPFLVGGGSPSHGIVVRRNYLYGIGMRIGYGAENEDCDIENNVIANGTLSIQKYKKVTDQNNLQKLPPSLGVLIPNTYDPKRAHIAAYDGAKAGSANVPVPATFMKAGEKFKLYNPEDFYGKPVFEGACGNAQINVPVASEFAAYVLVKD